MKESDSKVNFVRFLCRYFLPRTGALYDNVGTTHLGSKGAGIKKAREGVSASYGRGTFSFPVGNQAV